MLHSARGYLRSGSVTTYKAGIQSGFGVYNEPMRFGRFGGKYFSIARIETHESKCKKERARTTRLEQLQYFLQFAVVSLLRARAQDIWLAMPPVDQVE